VKTSSSTPNEALKTLCIRIGTFGQREHGATKSSSGTPLVSATSHFSAAGCNIYLLLCKGLITAHVWMGSQHSCGPSSCCLYTILVYNREGTRSVSSQRFWTHTPKLKTLTHILLRSKYPAHRSSPGDPTSGDTRQGACGAKDLDL
jgi:hypothetical protein